MCRTPASRSAIKRSNSDVGGRLIEAGEREYMVRVMGKVEMDMLHRIVEGVMLEDAMARFTDITDAGGEGINHWFYVVIMEGRKREVRRLWEAVGVTVSRLKRVRYGPIILDSSVKVGQYRELTRDEQRDLLKVADLQDRRPWGTLQRRPKKPAKAPASSPWSSRSRR